MSYFEVPRTVSAYDLVAETVDRMSSFPNLSEKQRDLVVREMVGKILDNSDGPMSEEDAEVFLAGLKSRITAENRAVQVRRAAPVVSALLAVGSVVAFVLSRRSGKSQ